MPHSVLGQLLEALDPEAGSLQTRLGEAAIRDLNTVRRRFEDAVEFAKEFQLRRGVKAVKFDRAARDAGTLLFEARAVDSVDAGIVLFHERLARDNPSLLKIFRRRDMRAGRLTVARPSPAQMATREILRGALVSRDDKGRITAFKPEAKAALRKVKAKQAAIDRERVGKQRERARKALRRLGAKQTPRRLK